MDACLDSDNLFQALNWVGDPIAILTVSISWSISDRANFTAGELMDQTLHKATTLSYTASLITQGKHKFYSFTMPSDILASTCFVLHRDEDPQAGFQRHLSQDRGKEIAAYIDEGFGSIPTSIILSAQEEAEFSYDNKKRTVHFRPVRAAFLIIDGQHRVYGFGLAKSKLRVPVVVYNDLTRKDEARLFIDINTKQRAVPNELLLDIQKIAEYRNEVDSRLADLFDMFSTENTSPLLGLMSPFERRQGSISRVTFNSALKPLFAQLGKRSNEEIYHVLASFFRAFIEESDRCGLAINVTQRFMFRAIVSVFPDVASKVRDRHGKMFDRKNFGEVLREMFSDMKAQKLKNAKTLNELKDLFTNALRNKDIF